MQQVNKVRESDDPGVTFSDIVRTIKNLKYYLIIIILIAFAVSISLVGFRPGTDDPVIFFVELVSIKNKAYPNGAIFSPNDLLSADVLQSVKNKYGISDYKSLREAITVDFGSPAAEGVSRKYSDQLAQKNLTQADITTINNNFALELSGLNEKSLRISVEPKRLGVSEAVAKQIAREIPKQWSEFSFMKYKIFEDKFLSSADIPPQTPKFTNSTNILVAYKIVNQMTSNISHMLRDNRIIAIKTDGGKSAADLSSEIDRFLSIFFMPIFAYYKKNDEQIYAFYIDEIKFRLEEFDSRIAGIDSIVESLRQERRQDVAGTRAFDGQKGTEMVQLGESGIKNILDLAERASLSAYLKDTLEVKRMLVFDRSALQKEVDRLTKYLVFDKVISDSEKEVSETMLSEIRNQYVELLQKCRQKLESDQKLLYSPVGDPISPGLISKTTLQQVLGTFGVSALLCLLLVVIKLVLKPTE